jgi:hypothetical protein
MHRIAVVVMGLLIAVPVAASDKEPPPNLDLRAEGLGRALELKSWLDGKAGRFAMTLHREGRKVEEWWGGFRAELDRGWLHLERRRVSVDPPRERI